MLHPNEIKNSFKVKFQTFLSENISFKMLLLDIFVEGTAYVVGGYFRDLILHQKSRDLDIIVDLPSKILLEKVKQSGIPFKVNRHYGIKLILENSEVDLWCLENNWAFKNNLVKLNPQDKIFSIAKGCFYNYDALVINLHNYNYDIRFFRDFLKAGTLDILQEKVIYKTLNPTTEANILRAFYIQKLTGSTFSNNTKGYLLKKLGELSDRYGSSVTRLIEVRNAYPKYEKNLKDLDIAILVHETVKGIVHNNQFYLDL